MLPVVYSVDALQPIKAGPVAYLHCEGRVELFWQLFQSLHQVLKHLYAHIAGLVAADVKDACAEPMQYDEEGSHHAVVQVVPSLGNETF